MNHIVNYVNPYIDINSMRGDYNRLSIIAGVHGNELETILCLNQIKSVLDNDVYEVMKRLPGFIDINLLCCANISAVRKNSRASEKTKDDGDLNRGWGDESENCRDEIKSLIDTSDVLIDMHCSYHMVSSGFLIDTDQTYSEMIIEWCREFDIPFCVRDCNNSTIKKYIDKYCGKIGLTWEQPMHRSMINKNTFLEDYGSLYWMTKILPAIPKLMAMKRAYDKSHDYNKKSTMAETNSIMANYRLQRIDAPVSGIFVPNPQPIIKAGDSIGRMVCEDGSEISVCVEKGGRIWFCSELKYIKEGDWLVLFNQCENK